MNYDEYYGINRTLCDVLREMRSLHETRNYSSLLGLIEEAQSMANRMEAKLYDIKDKERWEKQLRELKLELKTLRKQRDDTEQKKPME